MRSEKAKTLSLHRDAPPNLKHANEQRILLISARDKGGGIVDALPARSKRSANAILS